MFKVATFVAPSFHFSGWKLFITFKVVQYACILIFDRIIRAGFESRLYFNFKSRMEINRGVKFVLSSCL